MPHKLDASRLSDFKPRRDGSESKEKRENVETPFASSGPWPSREPARDGQFTIRAPITTIERFKRLCKDDRRTYADMLGILMDRADLDVR